MWAAAPVSGGFKASEDRLKLSCSYMSLHVSIRNRFCAERLLEMSGFGGAFHLANIVHKLESLIMAQNERWRHA